MADYVVINKEQLESDLTAVADHIRAKSGTTESLTFPEGFTSAVDALEADFIGIKLSDFSDGYKQPRVADMRSLPTTESLEPHLLANIFSNANKNGNGGYFVRLEEVYLPNDCPMIGVGMFKNCSCLTTIYGYEKVKIIGIGAFTGCSRLKTMPFFPILQHISAEAFSACIGLTKMTLPNTVTSIYSTAFSGCTGLTDVTLQEGWNLTINLSWSTNLTQESLHKMIENLADLTGQTCQTFQVGNVNIAKIDEEHIAMLENKNWEYM